MKAFLLLFLLIISGFVFCEQNEKKSRKETFRPMAVQMPIVYRNMNQTMTLWIPVSQKQGARSGGQCPNGTKILIFMLSTPEHFKMRAAIRNSWAKELPQDTSLFFVVGDNQQQKQHALVDKFLARELSRNGDIIRTDQPDTYRNLFLKTHAFLGWREHFCPEARWLLKVDMDALVDVDRLKQWIQWRFESLAQNEPERRVIYGDVNRNKCHPVRDSNSRWYVSREEFSGECYPRYLNGPVYLMTGEAASAILRATPEVKAIPIDDTLFTGILAKAADVARVDASQHLLAYAPINRKGQRRIPFTCENGTIPELFAVGAGVNPTNVGRVYELLHGLQCPRERNGRQPRFKKLRFIHE